ncbi:MAG: type II toxin-antitoxin system PemK/MazF family toxin [Thermocrispum sp.]
MFRGDVWDVQFPRPIGARPCVVLTVNALITRIGAVTVAEITGTEGPRSTHIEVGPDGGLPGRARSFVNATAVHTVGKGKLRRLRGRLGPAQVDALDAALSLYLDLESLRAT